MRAIVTVKIEDGNSTSEQTVALRIDYDTNKSKANLITNTAKTIAERLLDVPTPVSEGGRG